MAKPPFFALIIDKVCPYMYVMNWLIWYNAQATILIAQTT